MDTKGVTMFPPTEAHSNLAEIHARTDDEASAAADLVLGAYQFGPEPPADRSIVLDVLA